MAKGKYKIIDANEYNQKTGENKSDGVIVSLEEDIASAMLSLEKAIIEPTEIQQMVDNRKQKYLADHPEEEKNVEYAITFEDKKKKILYMRFLDPKNHKPFFYYRDLTKPFDITTIRKVERIEFKERVIFPIPHMPTQSKNRLDTLINPPTALVPFTTYDELINEFGELFSSVMYLEQEALDAVKLYVAWVQFYSKTDFFPLLRGVSPLGKAKTRMCISLFYLIPNALLIIDPSAAALKRIARKYKTFLIIDEGDPDQAGDENSLKVKYYNAGTSHESPYVEANKESQEGEKDIIASELASPKGVFSRKNFPDEAVESKSMSVELPSKKIKELKKAGVPLRLKSTNEFYKKARQFTNKFATATMALWPEVVDEEYDWLEDMKTNKSGDLAEIAEFIEENIEPRLLQTFDPLLIMQKHLKDAKGMLIGIFLRNVLYSIEKMQESHDGLTARSFLGIYDGELEPDTDSNIPNSFEDPVCGTMVFAKALYSELVTSIDNGKAVTALHKLGLKRKRVRIEVKVRNKQGDEVIKKKQVMGVFAPTIELIEELRRKYGDEQKEKIEALLNKVVQPVHSDEITDNGSNRQADPVVQGVQPVQGIEALPPIAKSEIMENISSNSQNKDIPKQLTKNISEQTETIKSKQNSTPINANISATLKLPVKEEIMHLSQNKKRGGAPPQPAHPEQPAHISLDVSETANTTQIREPVNSKNPKNWLHTPAQTTSNCKKCGIMINPYQQKNKLCIKCEGLL